MAKTTYPTEIKSYDLYEHEDPDDPDSPEYFAGYTNFTTLTISPHVLVRGVEHAAIQQKVNARHQVWAVIVMYKYDHQGNVLPLNHKDGGYSIHITMFKITQQRAISIAEKLVTEAESIAITDEQTAHAMAKRLYAIADPFISDIV